MSDQAGTAPSAPTADTPAAASAAASEPTGAASAPLISAAAVQQPSRNFSQDEVNSFLAQERRRWQESQEVKDLRAKAKRAEELEAAQLTESERLTRRATEAEAKAAELESRYRDAAIRARFATEALAAGIPAERIDAAYKLADLSAVALGEGGEVSGVDRAVKALPEWLRVAQPVQRPAPDINAGAGGGRTDTGRWAGDGEAWLIRRAP